MKIAFIGTKGIPATHGGIERYVEDLSVRLAARGHNITVFNRASYTDFRGNYKGINVITLFAPSNKYLSMLCHTLLSIFYILFSMRRFDIIHIHGADMSVFSLLSKLSAKVVVTSHGKVYQNVSTVPYILKIFSRVAEMCYISWPHARIAVSKSLAEYYSRKNKNSVMYIPVGVTFNNTRRSGSKFSQFNLGEGNYILFVGRLIPTKKVDLLIEAYKSLDTDKKLVIVGDAPYKDSIYALNLKKNESEKIKFLGFQYGETLADLYKNCLFFVLPSENEGLPVVILEALSFGCSIIASDIGANVEALNGYGITFKSGSADDLRVKMKYLLNHPNILNRFRKNAMQYIRNHYNWDDVVTKHENLYRSLERR